MWEVNNSLPMVRDQKSVTHNSSDLPTGGWREREKAREDSWGPPRDSRPPGDREWDRDKDRDENEKDREFDRERDFDRDDRFRRPRFDSFV